MEKPVISIITITFNSEKTVRETLESVRRQGYDKLEYIIVDGGSTDRTLAIVGEYDDVVTRVVSEKDNGISDAMNKGIRMAAGDLVGIIHSDDQLCDGALETLAAVWDGKTDVYYGNAVVCDESGKHTHVLKAKEDLSRMPYRFEIVHPATFVTKACYEKHGVFDEKYKCAMDYDLLLRFYRAGAAFRYLDENLAVYRAGGTNQKYRRRTIDEVYEVSVAHGGRKMIAGWEREKKLLKEKIKPVIRKLNLKNSRVSQLPE